MTVGRLAGLVMLYPLWAWFAGVKARRTDWWLSCRSDYPDAETNMFVLMDDAGKVARSFSSRCADPEWSERGRDEAPRYVQACCSPQANLFFPAQSGKKCVRLT